VPGIQLLAHGFAEGPGGSEKDDLHDGLLFH
jgi:hypothetical protein